jgi:hypothetical protein
MTDKIILQNHKAVSFQTSESDNRIRWAHINGSKPTVSAAAVFIPDSPIAIVSKAIRCSHLAASGMGCVARSVLSISVPTTMSPAVPRDSKVSVNMRVLDTWW